MLDRHFISVNYAPKAQLCIPMTVIVEEKLEECIIIYVNKDQQKKLEL